MGSTGLRSRTDAHAEASGHGRATAVLVAAPDRREPVGPHPTHVPRHHILAVLLGEGMGSHDLVQ